MSKVNTATGSVVTSIKVGSWPTDVQIDRAGYNLYVTNGWERNLSKISTGTDAVTSTFGLGSPHRWLVTRTHWEGQAAWR